MNFEMRDDIELKENKIGNYCGRHGKSTVKVQCPFCNTIVIAHVWSMSAIGKKCSGCGALHSIKGYSYREKEN